jgi:hypothetical protein
VKSKFFWIGYCESKYRIWAVIPLERSPVTVEKYMVENERGVIQWKTHKQITRWATISGKISKKLEVKLHDRRDLINEVDRANRRGYMFVNLNKLNDVHFFFPNLKKNLEDAVMEAWGLALHKGLRVNA